MTGDAHVVCPHCAAVNRLPAQRLAGQPRCGVCHQALFTGQSFALTAASFPKHVGRSSLPVLVDFWAPWCGPCRMMAPAYEQAAARLEPYIRLAKVDTEAEPALGEQFGIRSIPTLALFSQGRELARHSGALGAADIIRWVAQAIEAGNAGGSAPG